MDKIYKTELIERIGIDRITIDNLSVVKIDWEKINQVKAENDCLDANRIEITDLQYCQNDCDVVMGKYQFSNGARCSRIKIIDNYQFNTLILGTKRITSSIQDILIELIHLYFVDIFESDGIDQLLIQYLYGKLSSGINYQLQKYFGVLLLCGKTIENSDETESRKNYFYDELYKTLLCWISHAKQYDLLLSTISLKFFEESLWKKI